MTNGAFIRGLGLGLAGSVVVGFVLRDSVPMAVAMAIVGVVVGLVDGKRPALLGLWVGQLASFPALIAIELTTSLRTFVNWNAEEFAGLWPLIALIYLAFLACGALGFLVAARAGAARRARVSGA